MVVDRLRHVGPRWLVGSGVLSACSVVLTAVLVLPPSPAAAQQPVPRILKQDSTLDNLSDPPGYETAPLGSLGAVVKRGHGPRAMVLIAGLGFGGDVFEPLLERWSDHYTMYAVTIPGFGGTAAPPVPPAGTSFGEQTWTRGALAGIEQMIQDEALSRVVVVGHWLGGTQVALQLARRHPDRVEAVVLLAGSARWVAAQPDSSAPDDIPLAARAQRVDRALAPRWFKTVTRETWDDNNFLPGDYAVNPVLGLRLWRQAASAPLHVWVRYLCEFFAQDATVGLADLAVPILLVRPGLEGVYHDPGNNYMYAFTARSWGGIPQRYPHVREVVVPNTRGVPWADRPEAVTAAVDAFLTGTGS